tara:strand:+ start:1895 stop:2092 length:198 start_codon:yes stop_codon:yes gene_type:complete
MPLISKPTNIKDWPDSLKLTVYGGDEAIPIYINYKNQQIMLPNEAMDRQDLIATYLIDEGFIEVK